MAGNKFKILVADAESRGSSLVSALLESNGYRVICAKTCAAAQSLFSSHTPDLVILNPAFPDSNGISFLINCRKSSLVPFIILSDRADEKSKVTALDSGANDYVTKPFGSEELLARVRSLLRSSRRSCGDSVLPGGKFAQGGIVIDYAARSVFIGEAEVHLTQTEYNILALLSENCGKVMTYASIIKAVWGYPDAGSKKKLQVNIANIRKKLCGADCVKNKPGVGYSISCAK